MGKLYKRAKVSTYRTSLLHSRAHRAFSAFMAGFLGDIGLSLSQWVLLGLLFEKGEMQPAQIASQLGVKPPVATTLIADLEHKHMLERKPHTSDSRSSLIALTATGNNIVVATEKRLAKELRAFMHDLTLPELMVYTRVLAKLSAKIPAK